MARIVVTGGAGFLGSHLCEALIERGDEVVCIDNLVSGNVANIEALRGHPAFTYVVHDVSEHVAVDGVVDAVMHLASPASPSDFSRIGIPILKVGSLGTHNCLGLALKMKARFFLASTSEVYGDATVHPQPEAYWGNVNAIGPRGVYDEAKRFAEAMTMAYHRSHGVDVTIARIFNTYGPKMRLDDGRVIANFMTQALRGEPLTIYGEGEQTRCYCFVDDQINGLLRLFDAEITGPVNIGSDVETTVSELAATVIEVTNSESVIDHLPLPQDDPRRRRPDLTVARRELGWSPSVALVDGLATTAAWFSDELRAAERS